MQNLAEQLKNELESAKLPDWLAEDVANEIKNFGYAAYICGSHVRESSKSFAFPIRYEQALIKWGKDNGFKVSFTRNSYGVKNIVFKL